MRWSIEFLGFWVFGFWVWLGGFLWGEGEGQRRGGAESGKGERGKTGENGELRKAQYFSPPPQIPFSHRLLFREKPKKERRRKKKDEHSAEKERGRLSSRLFFGLFLLVCCLSLNVLSDHFY